jgi:hypothetical protein
MGSTAAAGGLNCSSPGTLSASVLAVPLPIEAIAGRVNPSLEKMRELLADAHIWPFSLLRSIISANTAKILIS